MISITDLDHSPNYRAEFRELDPSRYPLPATTRYVPREAAVIGMFDTTREPAPKKGTSHALTDSMRAQALANRKARTKRRTAK
jgi:hypothetical protein